MRPTILQPVVFAGILTSALACTVWEFGPGGLASGINQLYLLYPVFDGTNGTFYLDNRHNSYSCSETGSRQNGWHDFFQVPGVLNWKEEEDRSLGKVCRRIKEADEVNRVVSSVGLGYTELQTEAALKLWKFQPWMQARIDMAMAQMSPLPRPTIGFHMRGGDKFEEDKMGNRKRTLPKDILRTFTETYPGVKGGTCVLMGDDMKLVNELKELAVKELGCKSYMPHSYHKEEGHFQPDFITLDLNARCDATVQVLMDIELLAHTDYFVGSYNSGMVGLIEILRYALYGKSRFTFVDASEHHRDWFQNIRKYIGAKAKQ